VTFPPSSRSFHSLFTPCQAFSCLRCSLLRLDNNKRSPHLLECPPSPITHPPSIVASLFHLFNLTSTSRFLASNNNTTSLSSPAQSRHLAAAATSATTTSLAHSLALSQERRKADTAARPTASRWHMNTNLILQTTGIGRQPANSRTKVHNKAQPSSTHLILSCTLNRSNPPSGRHLHSQNKKIIH
jgi:hypothetical protein